MIFFITFFKILIIILCGKNTAGQYHNEVYNYKKGELQSIPNDIPTDVVKINLDMNFISSIPRGSFSNLDKCTRISIESNKITVIKNHAFTNLAALQFLSLYFNQIKRIAYKAFNKLPNLVELNLDKNRLHVIKSYYFKFLPKLKRLYLFSNWMTNITKKAISRLSNLQEINLGRNNLTSSHFYPGFLPNHFHLNLKQNRIIRLKSKMFAKVYKLTELSLFSNIISVIEPDAFHNLSNLCSLDLGSNKLLAIHQHMFLELKSIHTLRLGGNSIKHIAFGSFASFIQSNPSLCKPNMEDEKSHYKELNLYSNNIERLSWKVFSDNQFDKDKTVKQFKSNVQIKMQKNTFTCDISLCWMIQGIEERWFGLYDSLTEQPLFSHPYDLIRQISLPVGCYDKLALTCPSRELCVSVNSEKCQDYCFDENYNNAKMSQNNSVCAFEEVCECTCLNISNCKSHCAAIGKIAKQVITGNSNCPICNCECEIELCETVCPYSKFEAVNNTFGCPECKCFCPDPQCDSQCGGVGLGLFINDSLGCRICVGCQHQDIDNRASIKAWLPVLLALFVLGIIIVAIPNAYKGNQRKTAQLASIGNLIDKIESEFDVFLKNIDSDLAKEIRECWIDPKAIECDKLLGRVAAKFFEGNFGIVWSSRLKQDFNKSLNVAVKIIKGHYNEVWHTGNKWTEDNKLKAHFRKIRLEIELDQQIVLDFLREVTTMRHFNHPNILSLIGVSVHDDKPCVVLPLMTNGDLKTYVKAKSSTLKNQDLLKFALGTARGVAHLVAQKFVHRDLAARNCMLDGNLTIKVCDFGLGRDISDKDYYRVAEGSMPMPIRWMSIEAMQHSIYTEKSDVWSFGVLLWEIYTCGELPYSDIKNHEICQFLAQGNRLERPEAAPDYIYEMMVHCWKVDPFERPSFIELVLDLNKHLEMNKLSMC